MQVNDPYAQALAGEAEYWDNFIAQRLALGEIPGSVDFRLFFTQFSYKHHWGPPCLGPLTTNFREKEINYILRHAVPHPGTRVLDLGCGAGWLSLELARQGAFVTAIDISPTNLALGRYMVETNPRNFPFLYQRFAGLPCKLEGFGSVEYVSGDLNTINLPNQEYDAVVVWDSLHHVSNLERLFEQIRGTLKPHAIFVGVDHAGATPRTLTFNQATLPWLDDFYAWIAATDPEWLYDAVNTYAKHHAWDVLSGDYGVTPIPGFDTFEEQVRAEMQDIIRKTLPEEAITKPRVGTHQQPDETEASPFEDVSAGRLAQSLLREFGAERFQTICPFVTPERHIPSPRSEKERIFQHYLAAMLVEIGERAIARGQADGQWFLFHLTPDSPQTEAETILGPSINQPETGLKAPLEERLDYITHLEAELERKNAALADLETRLRQREAELIEARRPRLPWKSRKRNK